MHCLLIGSLVAQSIVLPSRPVLGSCTRADENVLFREIVLLTTENQPTTAAVCGSFVGSWRTTIVVLCVLYYWIEMDGLTHYVEKSVHTVYNANAIVVPSTPSTRLYFCICSSRRLTNGGSRWDHVSRGSIAASCGCAPPQDLRGVALSAHSLQRGTVHLEDRLDVAVRRRILPHCRCRMTPWN